MNEHAYNRLRRIVRELKKTLKTDSYTLLKENGYNVDLMYEHGFIINHDSEKSILTQAYEFNESRSEIECDY